MGGAGEEGSEKSSRAGRSSPGCMQGNLSRGRRQTLHPNHEKVPEGPEAFDTAAFSLATIAMKQSWEVMGHKDKNLPGQAWKGHSGSLELT